jgi:voltage-gated hydrogen channel 1
MPTLGGGDNDNDGSDQPLLSTWCSWSPSVPSHARRRRQVRDWLSSKTKHYIVMGLVAMDVGVIITDIFVSLVACDLKLDRDGWVEQTHEALHLTALVFSCLFLLELLATVWAFGPRYEKSAIS